MRDVNICYRIQFCLLCIPYGLSWNKIFAGIILFCDVVIDRFTFINPFISYKLVNKNNSNRKDSLIVPYVRKLDL